DMAQVSGVGARKLERYGQAFLDVLTDSPGGPPPPPPPPLPPHPYQNIPTAKS
ncbi:HRDC domain-containing protein, partial [Pseudomonas aeruginosa]|nr:HRDC domain-containing protein [Pseudomonas aeruginosa]